MEENLHHFVFNNLVTGEDRIYSISLNPLHLSADEIRERVLATRAMLALGEETDVEMIEVLGMDLAA